MSGTPYDVPDQRGRTAIVTGANSGLGFEIAARLARAGADVTLAVRDAAKGGAARDRILASDPAATVTVAELDVASLASVARFAGEHLATGRPIDLLIANAGIMAVPDRRTSPDGHELQFATNYLGHVALAGRLLPLLRASGSARLVTLSSLAAWMGPIRFDDLQGERSYGAWRAYGQSKLADLLFALEFDRRSRAGGWGVAALAAHPGLSRTSLGANTRAMGSRGPVQQVIGVASGLMMSLPVVSQGPERGAEPALFAATSPDAIGGGYYGPSGPGEMTGGPAPARLPRDARDAAAAARLWRVAEELTGVPLPDR